jgi:hypothetical protein
MQVMGARPNLLFVLTDQQPSTGNARAQGAIRLRP